MSLSLARTALALVLIGGLGCSDPASPSGTSSATMSTEAKAYLTNALDIMQNNSVRKKLIDWPPLRSVAFLKAGAAQLPCHTYEAIRQGITALGDHHSSLILTAVAGVVCPPLPSLSRAPPLPAFYTSPVGAVLGGRFGYIRIPEYSNSTAAENISFADSIQALIRIVDASNPCGWVVDLRNNGGGNMWPMLAGVGPIVGEGRLGYFVNAEGRESAITYWNGGAWIVGSAFDSSSVQRSTAVYILRNVAPPPVAVAFNGGTASSGEAIAITFIGRPNTRSFGIASAGLSTANSGFPLGDGAILNLTTGVDADRTHKQYGGTLTPDQIISGTAGPSTTDVVTQAATQWLATRPGCAP